MTRKVFVMMGSVGLLACGVAGAQNLKPGLWEMTQAMQGQAGGKDVAAAQAQAQREFAVRFGVNVAMYALTGNYKGDQVHVDSILERLRR